MVLFGMDLGPHWAFIVAAYAVMILVVAALIAWVLVDHRIQARTLADLEERGLTRRSGRRREGA
ncbi:heme exporter protein CcmD [Labrys wisconsinensis]|uniref:Heme exporter protein D n=1 Tax=Labrys wisconsinensis TaxID=425677 RepID=A0ABU0J1Y8_9HYPH|nr:heme exporter protein CcmD [Labrys wisconsinensis]MDQ0468264.1 heme exporter protein D [Labrys wisconsinensis]